MSISYIYYPYYQRYFPSFFIVGIIENIFIPSNSLCLLINRISTIHNTQYDILIILNKWSSKITFTLNTIQIFISLQSLAFDDSDIRNLFVLNFFFLSLHFISTLSKKHYLMIKIFHWVLKFQDFFFFFYIFDLFNVLLNKINQIINY